MRTKNCFRWLPLFLFQLFSSFAVVSPALNQSAAKPSFGSWTLGLTLCLNIWFRKVEGLDTERFAGTWVYLWGQAQSHSRDCWSTRMHRVGFFSRAMLSCCTLQLLAVLIYLSIYLSVQHCFYKITVQLGPELFLSKSGCEIFMWAGK